MEDAHFHELLGEKDGIADHAVELTSCLVLFGIEVVDTGLDVVVDVVAVDLNRLFLEFGTLGVEEGVANVLQLCDVIGADLVTALHLGGELGVEVAEFGDASAILFGGGICEVLIGGLDVSDEGVDILDAR